MRDEFEFLSEEAVEVLQRAVALVRGKGPDPELALLIAELEALVPELAREQGPRPVEGQQCQKEA